MRTVKLGDICLKIGSGATPKGGKNVYTDTGTALIRSQNVHNLDFVWEGLARISDDAASKLANVTLEPNDVLLNITGDSVARVCLVPEEALPARVNQHVAIVRPDPEILDPRYLVLYLASPYMQSYMLNRATGKGASRNAITKDMIASFEVPAPALDTQRKTIARLSAYDSLIENNRKQIKLLEEAAQRLYKEWFIDLRFPGHEVAEIDTDTGLPEGWKADRPVGELIEKLESGKRPKGGIDKTLTSGVPSIGAENVIGIGRYNYDSEKIVPVEFFEGMRRGVVHDRDILVYKDGAYTGRVSLIQDGFPYEKCAVNEHVFLVSAKKESDQYWLYFTLERKGIFNAIQKVAISSAQPGINQDDFKSIKILIPTEDFRRQYTQTVAKLVSQIILLAKQIRTAVLARDRLLSKLMEGEVEL